MKTTILLSMLIVGCNSGPFENGEHVYARARLEKWNEPCHDNSTLLATTSGSPNSHECPNKRHRMRVETVTKAGEEIAALAFCECDRDTGGK